MHIQLNLTTTVKDKKNFVQIFQQQKEGKENLHPLLHSQETIVTKVQEV